MTGKQHPPTNLKSSRAEFLKVPTYAELWGNVLLHMDAFSQTGFLQNCEEAIGLDQPNMEFRKEVAHAASLSIAFYATQPKSASTVRDECNLIAKRAAEAAANLQQLSEALGEMAWPELPEPLPLLMAPASCDRLRWLAETARKSSALCGDDGRGRPPLAAFYLLVSALADAYAGTTGRAPPMPKKITGTNIFGGPFVEFVRLVLQRIAPLVREKERKIGKQFAPQGDAIGERVKFALERKGKPTRRFTDEAADATEA